MFKEVRRDVLASTDRSQTPWTGSSITGDFFFNLPEPIEPEPEPRPAATPPELVFWSAIKDSQNAADFETFLELYPDSVLAPLVRRRLDDLRATETAALPAPEEPAAEPEPEPEPPAPAVPDPAAIERALGLTDDDRALVQRVLTALGHDPRGVDGRFGPSTRLAIAAWQQARGEDASGYLSDSQLGAVRKEAETQVAVGLYEPPRQYRASQGRIP